MDQIFDSVGRELRYIEYKIRQHRAQSKKEKQNRREKQNDHEHHHHRHHENNNHHRHPENSYVPKDFRRDDESKAAEFEEQARKQQKSSGGQRVTLTDKDRLEKTLKESSTVAAKVLERTRGNEKSTDTPISTDPWSVPVESKSKSDYFTSDSRDSNGKDSNFLSLSNAGTSINVPKKESLLHINKMPTPASQEWPAPAEQVNFGGGFDPFALATDKKIDDLLFNDTNDSNLTQKKSQSKDFKDTVDSFLGADAAQILNVNKLINTPQSRNLAKPNPFQKKSKAINELKKPDGIQPFASPPTPTWTTDFSSPNDIGTLIMQPSVFTSTVIQQTCPLPNQPQANQPAQNNFFF